MGQNTTVLGIVGVVILIVVLVSPTLFVGIQNFINELFEGWSSFWSQHSGLGGVGNANVGATLHYEDGTQETIQANKGVPLTVTYGSDGPPLVSIDFNLWGIFSYKGTLQNLYIDATLEFDFNRDGTPERTTSTKKYDTTIPDSGASNLLTQLTLQKSELEGWAETSGEHATQVRGRAKLTATFTDGTVQTLETSEDATGTFKFNIEVMGTTSVLDAYLGATPWVEPPEWK